MVHIQVQLCGVHGVEQTGNVVVMVTHPWALHSPKSLLCSRCSSLLHIPALGTTELSTGSILCFSDRVKWSESHEAFPRDLSDSVIATQLSPCPFHGLKAHFSSSRMTFCCLMCHSSFAQSPTEKNLGLQPYVKHAGCVALLFCQVFPCVHKDHTLSKI